MRGVTILLLALSAGACGGDAAGSPVASPLAGGAPSLEALGRAVLTGLAAADTAALDRLRLDREEHHRHVWPHLPASNPRAGVSVELVWDGIVSRNDPAQRVLLRRWGGKLLHHRGTRCDGPVHHLGPLVVREGCSVSFTVGDDPTVRHLWLDEVLAWGGRHKLFRYYLSR